MKEKIQNPGWKSLAAFLVAVLLASAEWFTQAGLETYGAALSVQNLPHLVLALGPVFWAYGLNSPLKK